MKSDLAQAAEFEHIPPAEELLQRYPHNLELVAYFLNRCDQPREIWTGSVSFLQRGPSGAGRRRMRDSGGREAWCEDTDGETAQAERSLRRAFELDRYWWQIHFQLHDLLRRLGRHEESARFFKIYKISKDSEQPRSRPCLIRWNALNDQKFLPVAAGVG